MLLQQLPPTQRPSQRGLRVSTPVGGKGEEKVFVEVRALWLCGWVGVGKMARARQCGARQRFGTHLSSRVRAVHTQGTILVEAVRASAA